MKRKTLLSVTFAVVVLLAIGAVWATENTGNKKSVIVAFVGSASKPVLEEAAQDFEAETKVKVELHFGGSGTMLAQMKISEIGDLYIPGSHDYMIRAIDGGVVNPETVQVLAYLVPAIIVPEGNPKNITCLEDLTKPGVRVGIGDPESVCVGEYAVALLKHNGLWSSVEKNIVVNVESCSAVATLAVTGQVDAVIGWRVFERWNPNKTDVVLINPECIPKVAYIPAALSTYTENRSDALRFLDFLASEKGQSIFSKYGYITTVDEARVYAPVAELPLLR